MYKKIILLAGVSILALNVEAASGRNRRTINTYQTELKQAADEAAAAHRDAVAAAAAGNVAALDAHQRAADAARQRAEEIARRPGATDPAGHVAAAQGSHAAALAAHVPPPPPPRVDPRAARIAVQQAAGQATGDARRAAAGRPADELPTGLPGGSDDDLGPTPAEAAAEAAAQRTGAATRIQALARGHQARNLADKAAIAAEAAETARKPLSNAWVDEDSSGLDQGPLRASGRINLLPEYQATRQKISSPTKKRDASNARAIAAIGNLQAADLAAGMGPQTASIKFVNTEQQRAALRQKAAADATPTGPRRGTRSAPTGSAGDATASPAAGSDGSRIPPVNRENLTGKGSVGSSEPGTPQAAAVPTEVTRSNATLLAAQAASDAAPTDLSLAKAFQAATLALYDTVNGTLKKSFDTALLTQYTDRADKLKSIADKRIEAIESTSPAGSRKAASNALANMFAGRASAGSSTPSNAATPTTPAASSKTPAKKWAAVDTTAATPSPSAGAGGADEDGEYDSEGDPILSASEQRRMKKEKLTRDQIVAARKPRTGTPASPAAAGGSSDDGLTDTEKKLLRMGISREAILAKRKFDGAAAGAGGATQAAGAGGPPNMAAMLVVGVGLRRAEAPDAAVAERQRLVAAAAAAGGRGDGGAAAQAAAIVAARQAAGGNHRDVAEERRLAREAEAQQAAAALEAADAAATARRRAAVEAANAERERRDREARMRQ